MTTVAQAKDAVPGMGYYAYFNDTDGNIMGLWQTDSSAGAEPGQDLWRQAVTLYL